MQNEFNLHQGHERKKAVGIGWQTFLETRRQVTECLSKRCRFFGEPH